MGLKGPVGLKQLKEISGLGDNTCKDKTRKCREFRKIGVRSGGTEEVRLKGSRKLRHTNGQQVHE